MNTASRRYRAAAVAGGLGLGAILWAILAGPEPPPFSLLLAAAAAPAAIMLAVWALIGGRFPRRALVGGAIIGPLVALASHAAVATFADAFLLGFAESGRELLDSLRADPKVIEVLGSPWVLVLLIELSVVAPLTEEVGKALGAALGRPSSREQAFLAGVAAGSGFAIVENVLYASLGSVFGGPWPAILLGRSLGAAVHPLASGFVVLGWWEWRHGGTLTGLAKRFLAGAGVHALWNGSLVALAVVETAYAKGPLGPAGLAYSAAIGLALAGALWLMTARVVADRDPLGGFRADDARTLAAWIVVAASFLVPVVLLVLAFPDFYAG
jgi:RsiW-degrading membrane proteinase PrsW (M82 family)